MVCKKCGHHSENSYGVCPFCGEVVKKSKSFTAGIIMLTVGICFVIVATVVVCGVVFSSTRKILPREERYEQTGVYNDVSHPVLQAEPLPEADYELRSEPLPESKPKLKDESVPQTEKVLKKEPVKSVAVNQMEATTAKSDKSVVKTEKEKIVFSNGIGEINGKTYAIRCVGKHTSGECYCGAGVYDRLDAENSAQTIIPALPQNLKKDSLAFGSFCCYDGYVYYTVTECGTGPVNVSLYRCKSDFTGVECIAEWVFNYDGENDFDKEIYRNFVIYDDILYMNKEGYSLDLETKKCDMREYPDFTSYTGKNYENGVYIYGEKVFVCDNNSNSIVMYESGSRKELVSDLNYSFGVDGGYVNGYLYYSEIVDGGYAELRKMNVTTGDTEVIHKANVGGGGGPYFCF